VVVGHLPAGGETVTTPDRARVAGLLWGFFPAQVMQTLARLGVPDLLQAGPRPLADLAADTGANPDALHRLLRAAAGLGLVDSRADRWHLTADGSVLVSGVAGSLGNLAQLFCGDAVWRAWGELEWSVRTGEPSLEKITGMGTFEHMAENPALLAIFTEAMAEGSRMAAPGVVASCDLDGVGTLVDVGGGDGTLLAAFLSAHPDLHGILFDTPDGVGAAAGSERCDVVTGDFFTAVPTADAYVLKSVIHDWDDERSTAILTRIRDAMPSHGTLFLVEPVLAPDTAGLAAQRVTLMSDLNMLVCTGGRERTEVEFRALLDAAGLRLRDVTRVPPPTGFSVLAAVRA
jgi:orsellinic acid C2-O-methyltransferase